MRLVGALMCSLQSRPGCQAGSRSSSAQCQAGRCERRGQPALLPGAERPRNAAECPGSSPALQHKRWGCFTPRKTCQYHASYCKISSFGKVLSNPLQFPEWKWDNFEDQREVSKQTSGLKAFLSLSLSFLFQLGLSDLSLKMMPNAVLSCDSDSILKSQVIFSCKSR